MATSAFKSKRANQKFDSNSTQQTHPPVVRKRSMSVSAISKTKNSTDISSDFSNKRENPLFWSAISYPPEELNNMGKPPEMEKEKGKGNSAAEEQRGRSVTRNSSAKTGIGRSLSRVRQRSLSRGPCRSYECEDEQKLGTSALILNHDSKQVGSTAKIARNVADSPGRTRGSYRTSSQCKAIESSEDDSACSFQISNWEDGITTCSPSETEEMNIKTVCEQLMSFQVDLPNDNISSSGIYETVQSEVRRAISDIQHDIEIAIRRNNGSAFPTTNVADTPLDLVGPGPGDLLLDIRREYTQKLVQSEERASQLRADLAVEEQRGQEFNRILKEMLPDPKTSNPSKSHVGRKRSSERRKMSQRLSEEALAYFDECVSISTFDGSDFSAPEDPPYSSAGPCLSVRGTASIPPRSSSSCSNIKQDVVCGDQPAHISQDSNLVAYNTSFDGFSLDQVAQTVTTIGKIPDHQFHFASKQIENFELHDIKSYIKHFERGTDKILVNSDCKILKYDADEYKLHGRTETLLAERVYLHNRVESGGLHLCSGSIEFQYLPFSFVI